MNADARFDEAGRWRSTGDLCKHDSNDTSGNSMDPHQQHQRSPSKDDGYAAKYNMKKDGKKV